MFMANDTFSSYSVDDLEKAREFYTDILSFELASDEMGLQFELPGGGRLFLYEKDDHEPATFTVLNLVVEDIDAAVDELEELGISFEQYDNQAMPQDERGVLRGLELGRGGDVAWFEDSAANVLALIQLS